MDIALCEKYSLTIKEAAVYFGIGENRLREIAKEYLPCVLKIGSKTLIKRKVLEEYLDRQNVL